VFGWFSFASGILTLEPLLLVRHVVSSRLVMFCLSNILGWLCAYSSSLSVLAAVTRVGEASPAAAYNPTLKWPAKYGTWKALAAGYGSSVRSSATPPTLRSTRCWTRARWKMMTTMLKSVAMATRHNRSTFSTQVG